MLQILMHHKENPGYALVTYPGLLLIHENKCKSEITLDELQYFQNNYTCQRHSLPLDPKH